MLKLATFLAALLPLTYSGWQIYLLQSGAPNGLGADPGKALVLMQGEWTIRFLLITLLISPLRQITGWNSLIRIRRMLGLFTFFYASLHLLSYLVLLLELDFGGLWQDILKRPFITVGFAAWVLLLPLAVTSTNWMMRRLKKRWQILHRAIYLVAILAVVHLIWIARSSYAEAALYGGIIVLLLFLRLFGTRLATFRQALKNTF
jgi:sulfoxide reductase heme-binding subunit YedZ